MTQPTRPSELKSTILVDTTVINETNKKSTFTILDTLRTPAGKLAANIAAGENYEKATQNARNLADQVKEGLEEVMTEM